MLSGPPGCSGLELTGSREYGENHVSRTEVCLPAGHDAVATMHGRRRARAVQSPSPAAGRGRAGGATLNSPVGGATEPDQETCKQVCGTFSNPLSLAMDVLPHSHVSFPRAKNPAAEIISFKEWLLRGKEFHQLPRNH